MHTEVNSNSAGKLRAAATCTMGELLRMRQAGGLGSWRPQSSLAQCQIQDTSLSSWSKEKTGSVLRDRLSAGDRTSGTTRVIGQFSQTGQAGISKSAKMFAGESGQTLFQLKEIVPAEAGWHRKSLKNKRTPLCVWGHRMLEVIL